MSKIADYGMISDCHSVALISEKASIDWCCMPQVDSPSCFGRIIGEKSGYCQILPVKVDVVTRKYIKNTMILEYFFKTGKAEAKLVDCFIFERDPEFKTSQILRVIEGLEGEMDFKLEIMPRFDYGLTQPWIRKYNKNLFIAIASDQGLCISGNVDFNFKKKHQVQTIFRIKKSEKKYLSIQWGMPHLLDEGRFKLHSPAELEFLLEKTTKCWQSWASQCTFKGLYSDLVMRSALTLKALSNATTGGIAAAPTTSLPEDLNGNRNWDYRYCWIRDSYFTVSILSRIGFKTEADMFHRFIDRSSGDTVSGLQVLYGIDGRKFIFEHVFDNLSGYKGVKPVRIGNQAFDQRQLGNYGWLMELFHKSEQLNFSLREERWPFISGIVKKVIKSWQSPDSGIWERRDTEENFVHSKVECWSTINRAISLAQKLNRKAPAIWFETRELIYNTIMKNGYDKKRGVFVQSFEHPEYMDSALLLLPIMDFVKYNDPKMIRTAQAVWQDLNEHGLIRRYPAYIDSLEGREGVFLASSFWLVICFARQGFYLKAQEIFRNALQAGNNLGLFSEEYNPVTKESLGNFPQAYTHLSLIGAALSLKHARKN